ncbi:ATP-dependent DNA helicase [Campylobacter ureolyticus]|uniref:ATP-dependent DNA helicase n=1 Tax=Campylobacter ureolyticus TaxID=827 RepID=UPI00046962B8|nr:AAA family ATPase [Campylobacter ureolyticus]MCZ6105926.1 AAA family ATPase [Campylobacter ureolyticus]MCZ6158552.1 AAA family ATPase [Campylobacter ureolyticus]MCZ6174647.1 AAA family ATPase [Campylobacter ureolyticus]MDU5326253.1 AAA family ATPase [Campylobacter ureolyticus]
MKDIDPLEFFEKNDKVFITGAGGVGKSYAVNQFCERYDEKEVLRTASTWKAAEIIGGKTVYSAFMINYTMTEQEEYWDVIERFLKNAYKLNQKENKNFEKWQRIDANLLMRKELNVLNIDKIDITERWELYESHLERCKNNPKKAEKVWETANSYLCWVLRTQAKVIIIDEISMISSEILERILNKIEKIGYYGKIILSGDFYQLPPVPEEGQIQRDYCFLNPKFKDFACLELTKIQRTDDIEFSGVQQKIRDGKIKDEWGDIDKSIDKFFRTVNIKPRGDEATYTHLYTRNREVDSYNEKMIERFKQNAKWVEYCSADVQKNGSVIEYADEIKKHRKKLEYGDMELFEGMRIMTRVNRPKEKYINGTHAVVIDIASNGDLICEKDDGEKIYIKKEEAGPNLNIRDEADNVVATFIFKQYPICPSYAITVHKSQGSSIDKVWIGSNSNGFFESGQLYTAISRARNVKHLYCAAGIKAIKVDPVVKEFYQKIENEQQEIDKEIQKEKENDDIFLDMF